MRTQWRVGMAETALLGALALGIAGCSGVSGRKATPKLGDDAIASTQVVAVSGPDRAALDAAPSPDGSIDYFTVNGSGGPAVLSAPSAGGATSTLTAGAPLVMPVGLAVATDGSHVFVADPEAGRVYSVSTGGGAPTAVAGTEGRSPRGLDVVAAGGHDVLYFTGTDPAGGSAGVFSVPASGGAVTVVAKGAPLVSPDAVVVSAGAVYVSDRGAAGGAGAVYKVSGSTITKVVGVSLGNPGGVSVTQDGKTLLVSSLDGATGADQLLMVDLASGKTAAVSKVIGVNHNSSGGLHRAYSGTSFAWADVRRSGRVYRVDPIAGT